MIGKAVRALRRPRVWIPVLAVLLAAAGSGYWFLLRPGAAAAGTSATSQPQWVPAYISTSRRPP